MPAEQDFTRLVRQLCSSLYLDVVSDENSRGKLQNVVANSTGDFRQAFGLQVFPIDLEITTITTITPICLGPVKARKRIGGPAHGL